MPNRNIYWPNGKLYRTSKYRLWVILTYYVVTLFFSLTEAAADDLENAWRSMQFD